MEKPIISQAELDVVRLFKTGKVDNFTCDEEQQHIMQNVLNRADEYLAETDAYDEIEGSLLDWFLIKCGVDVANI